jgi:hypothetical protein
MLENRNWELTVFDHETYATYYAQSAETSYVGGEKKVQSNLTRDEAMAMLSLFGTPNECGSDSCYCVNAVDGK